MRASQDFQSAVIPTPCRTDGGLALPKAATSRRESCGVAIPVAVAHGVSGRTSRQRQVAARMAASCSRQDVSVDAATAPKAGLAVNSAKTTIATTLTPLDRCQDIADLRSRVLHAFRPRDGPVLRSTAATTASLCMIAVSPRPTVPALAHRHVDHEGARSRSVPLALHPRRHVPERRDCAVTDERRGAVDHLLWEL